MVQNLARPKTVHPKKCFLHVLDNGEHFGIFKLFPLFEKILHQKVKILNTPKWSQQSKTCRKHFYVVHFWGSGQILDHFGCASWVMGGCGVYTSICFKKHYNMIIM